MNVFDAVKAELNARRVVESYGIAVRHNGMCCCPFHGDKNPSMKVDEKRFHCFGCGEDGDVIQFAARYFDLSRYDAAKKLAEDFGVAYEKWKPERDEKGKMVQPKPRPKSPEQIYREKEHHFYREISDHYHRLKDWKEQYKPKTVDEAWDERFIEALKYIPQLEYIMDSFLEADRDGRTQLFQAFSKTEQFCEQRNAEARKEPSVLARLHNADINQQSTGKTIPKARKTDAIAI